MKSGVFSFKGDKGKEILEIESMLRTVHETVIIQSSYVNFYQKKNNMTESMRRMSSIPDPTPNFDHRSQMRRVDKQYQLLKKRLIIAGSKVRERLLKEMRGLGLKS